ncbi:MAG: heme o synthase [Candidatus Eisenbacteria bacterium]
MREPLPTREPAEQGHRARPAGRSRPAPLAVAGQVRAYLELGKAGLATFVVLTTLVGLLVGGRGATSWSILLATLAGTAMTSSGSLALNQWIEHERDARMRRTARRPLPTGRLTPRHAFWVATASVVLGLALLAWRVNILTAALDLIVVLLYLLAYTPLKTRTPFCTLVGAICGAIPPMMGWSAATGSLGVGAYILGATLFLWQIPHFLALAWLYREDYERGGFRMLPAIDSTGRLTAQLALLYTLALIPIGIAATLSGMAGHAYLLGSLALGLAMLLLGLRLLLRRTERNARMLFFASLIYLPVLLGLLVADRGPTPDRYMPVGLVEAPAAASGEAGSPGNSVPASPSAP